MTKLKYVLPGFFLLSFCFFTLVLSLPSQGQTRAQQEQPNFERFPTTDLSAEESSDPVEREKRRKKGKKHNIKYVAPLSDAVDSMFLNIDWDVNLPALPTEKSAAVIIGRISKAQAYLSENKSGIYSEFTVKVDAILKNDVTNPLSVDSSIVVYRTGGRLRLPSGKFIVSAVSHQDMPQQNSRYLLFLTHNSLTGVLDEDFAILTGYELKNGKAFPLDKVLSGHPINKYTGVSENILLTDLSSALANSSPNLPPR
jgi:hypothetical protein